MQPRSSSRLPLVFGPFAFYEESGELSKHGVRIRLQGQPLQILSNLIREPGRVVTREEFQQQLWSASTFVDFEHGLNAAVNRLRQALGDTADNPRYVETLPGRGYRFIATVEGLASPSPVLLMAPNRAPATVLPETIIPEQIQIETPAPRPDESDRRGRMSWIIAAAVIISVFLGYLAFSRLPSSSRASSIRFSISPPEGYAMEAGSSRQTFALSPDGTRLAFTALDASGRFQVFIRDLDGIDARPLANSKGSYNVFWAPNGRSLFLTVGKDLRRSTLENDSYQVVCDTPPLMLSGLLMGPNLLISGRMTNYVVPVTGGTPRPIKELYNWPQMLPDGQHLLYTDFDLQSGHFRARVAKYGEPDTMKDLLETDSRVMYAPSSIHRETGHLVYVRGGNVLAQPFDPRSLSVQGEPLAVAPRTYSFAPTGAADFSVSNNGTLAYKRYQSRSQLAWVDRKGRVLRTIGPANVNLKQARLSPDGTKIAAPIFDPSRGVNDMWIIDAETGAARRTIAGPGQVDSPVWAPDSSKLAFLRAYDGPPALFVRGLGESDVDQPMPHDFFEVPSDWSRDGRFLAYTNTSFAIDVELKGDVWLIDLARGRKVIHLIKTPFHEANPAFSPDGRWLAFTSDESGRAEVYLQAFEAGESPRLVGERHLLSKQGAVALRWAGDGKELFYLAWDGRLYAVPVVLAPKLKIGEPAPLFSISLEARAALTRCSGSTYQRTDSGCWSRP